MATTPAPRAGERVTVTPATGADALPRHIAIIMDGNGRWARQRGLPRIEGHRQGVASVRRITEHCARIGIEQLTLYCLSSENWRRPAAELDFLMHLLEQYMIEERELLMRERIRIVMIGSRAGLPDATLAALDRTAAMCAGNDGMRLCLAINYGSRAEITAAARALVEECRAGRLDPASITEETLAERLDTYSRCIGLAFQVQDDILDVEGHTEVIGKPQGSDQDRDKPTYANLLGMTEAKATAQRLCDEALNALAVFDERANTLRELARYIVKRDR
jgi:undecaprenyl diphosphate synthase